MANNITNPTTSNYDSTPPLSLYIGVTTTTRSVIGGQCGERGSGSRCGGGSIKKKKKRNGKRNRNNNIQDLLG